MSSEDLKQRSIAIDIEIRKVNYLSISELKYKLTFLNI